MHIADAIGLQSTIFLVLGWIMLGVGFIPLPEPGEPRRWVFMMLGIIGIVLTALAAIGYCSTIWIHYALNPLP